MPGWPEVFASPVLEAAPRLLGAVLLARSPQGEVGVRLTEVEAYDGDRDPGSHAYRGPTRRNAVMFGPPGHLYVYFTYGMHHCMNVVCGPPGEAAAVLLRAGEVVRGFELARVRRSAGRDRDLARGPARMCRALGIDLSHNGTELTNRSSDDGPMSLLLSAEPVPAQDIRTGPRVGLRFAADRPWRFWVAGDPTVSSYRPAKKLG